MELQQLILEAWSNRELLKDETYSNAVRAVIEEVDLGYSVEGLYFKEEDAKAEVQRLLKYYAKSGVVMADKLYIKKMIVE